MLDKADSKLVQRLHPSPNFGERKNDIGMPVGSGVKGLASDCSVPPTMLLMHYTGMHSCAGAIDWLSRPESGVSCHYVIDVDGTITQMVAETHRAWHAGQGSWAGEGDINSASVGIEIHNPGHELGYPEFPDVQMAAVEGLAKDIVSRWGLSPYRVLGHSDIAPQRKGDPGEKFDWARLARTGVGHWITPEPVDVADIGLGLKDDVNQQSPCKKALINETRALLLRFGYGVAQIGGLDLALHKTVLAFQRHYRPARCDGRIDRSTIATLRQLLAGKEGGSPSPTS